MSVTVDNRRNRSGSALAAILTVLLLIPVGILFVQVWNDSADDRATTRRERQGVEYLTRLTPLVAVLAESQASALLGPYSPPAGLRAAVDGVADVDRRLSGTLKTQDRWSGISARIGQLPSIGSSTTALFQAHVEITDLTLALYQRVRDNSQLIRDADNDVSHLQQAAAEIATTVVQAARMADLSVLVANADSRDQRLFMPRFGASLLTVDTTINALTDDLQAAVDDTTSRTLSSGLIGPLDAFRRSVEELQRGANPTGAPDAATLATGRVRLTQTVSGLAGPVLDELDGLLQTRLDVIADRQRGASIAAGAAVLIALSALLVPLFLSRRRVPPGGRPGHPDSLSGVPDPGDRLQNRAPVYGDEDSSIRRERFGALR